MDTRSGPFERVGPGLRLPLPPPPSLQATDNPGPGEEGHIQVSPREQEAPRLWNDSWEPNGAPFAAAPGADPRRAPAPDLPTAPAKSRRPIRSRRLMPYIGARGDGDVVDVYGMAGSSGGAAAAGDPAAGLGLEEDIGLAQELAAIYRRGMVVVDFDIGGSAGEDFNVSAGRDEGQDESSLGVGPQADEGAGADLSDGRRFSADAAPSTDAVAASGDWQGEAGGAPDPRAEVQALRTAGGFFAHKAQLLAPLFALRRARNPVTTSLLLGMPAAYTTASAIQAAVEMGLPPGGSVGHLASGAAAAAAAGVQAKPYKYGVGSRGQVVVLRRQERLAAVAAVPERVRRRLLEAAAVASSMRDHRSHQARPGLSMGRRGVGADGTNLLGEAGEEADVSYDYDEDLEEAEAAGEGGWWAANAAYQALEAEQEVEQEQAEEPRRFGADAAARVGRQAAGVPEREASQPGRAAEGRFVEPRGQDSGGGAPTGPVDDPLELMLQSAIGTSTEGGQGTARRGAEEREEPSGVLQESSRDVPAAAAPAAAVGAGASGDRASPTIEGEPFDDIDDEDGDANADDEIERRVDEILSTLLAEDSTADGSGNGSDSWAGSAASAAGVAAGVWTEEGARRTGAASTAAAPPGSTINSPAPPPAAPPSPPLLSGGPAAATGFNAQPGEPRPGIVGAMPDRGPDAPLRIRGAVAEPRSKPLKPVKQQQQQQQFPMVPSPDGQRRGSGGGYLTFAPEGWQTLTAAYYSPSSLPASPPALARPVPSAAAAGGQNVIGQDGVGSPGGPSGYSDGDGGGAQQAPRPRLVLRAFLYCMAQDEVHNALWQTDLLDRVEFVTRLREADVVVHRAPAPGERQFALEKLAKGARRARIPFISVRQATEELLAPALERELRRYELMYDKVVTEEFRRGATESKRSRGLTGWRSSGRRRNGGNEDVGAAERSA